MKSDAALAALPMRERVAWQAAELIAAHNLAVQRMLTAAVAAGRNEKQDREAATPPGPSIQSSQLDGRYP